jgi:arabinosyltransferase C
LAAGLLGTLFALAVPLMPVKQTTAQLNWPQGGVLDSVTAPLIGYVPTDLSISVPCRAAAGLIGPDNTVLLSTVPKQAPGAIDRGLLIERVNDGLVVVVRNTPVISAPINEVLSPACERLTVTADEDEVVSEFVGLVKGPASADPGAPLREVHDYYDFRPQIVGVFTDLSGPAPPGLSLSAAIDTRYSTSPTLLKLLVMILGVVMTVVALSALHVLDTADGVRRRRFLPRRRLSFAPLDALVIAVLVWWHFVGANTSDDGYILTMARVSEDAGYMANYYRWFGTPEAPFGWYYDLLALWTHVSTSSIWVRLPTLLMALACWWVVSREVLPRLGRAVKTSRVAAWTAAGMFLAFWLPLNNGLRPEPIIALGILLTWCSVERGVATSRLLPVAVAIIVGALTVLSGPTGIAAVSALLVAISPLSTIVSRRSKRFGALALLAPIFAAGTVCLILVFRDQTLAGEIQANGLKSVVGPSLKWFDEPLRYERLFSTTNDGSVTRRLPVLVLLVAAGIAAEMSFRKARIAGTAAGPSQRIVGITVISLLMIMFTPTKWTHHFGVFAGVAGGLGALAAVAVTSAAMRSHRNRSVFAALVLFVAALSFASVNSYWYVSNFGVPWSNSFPAVGVGITTLLLGLTLLMLLAAAWFHFSGAHLSDTAGYLGKILQSPLAVVTWLVVVFEVFSLTAAMVSQYPAWSVGRSNLLALTGKTCGLADDVLVEQDPNDGMLFPIDAPVGDALGYITSEGFSPSGIPSDLTPDAVIGPSGGDDFAHTDYTDEDDLTTAGENGTEGGFNASPGINGSYSRLPFGLAPARTPTLGTYRETTQVPAQLGSSWYRLPARDAARPLLVVSAAGRFDPDQVGVQWAGEDGEPVGEILLEQAHVIAGLTDIGAPAWRNLRVPLSDIPTDATQIRLVAVDEDLAPGRWLALTPPRIPRLQTLQEVVGSRDPVLLDWPVGLAFPCQRPFGHRNGVIEAPKWRILPDHFGAEAYSSVMDSEGGGPLGISELLLDATTMSSYLKDDWFRDWGSLQRLDLFYTDAPPARLELGSETRGGMRN